MVEAQMRAATFNIDLIQGKDFEGYTLGEDWNGFACPYFTKEQADKLVEAWREQGIDASYNEKEDTFSFPVNVGSPQEETDTFPAVEVGGRKLYPIGAGCWIWSENEQ